MVHFCLLSKANMLSYGLFLATLASVPFALAHPKSYAAWAANSAIARGQGNGLGTNGLPVAAYDHGEFQVGLELLYAKTGDETYYNYIKTAVDNVLNADGTIKAKYK